MTMPGTEASPLYSVNEDKVTRVYVTILTKGPISQKKVAKQTGLSQGTVAKAVGVLRARNAIVNLGEVASERPGRRESLLAIAEANAPSFVGVSIYAKSVGRKARRQCRVMGVLTTIRGEERSVLDWRRLTDASPEGVVRGIAELVESLAAQSAGDVAGVGVELGGHVRSDTGTVVHSPNLDWSDVPLRELVEASTGLPATVENDVNALALRERWFGEASEDFAMVLVGDGVGGALVVGGGVVHGAHGGAGEIGHIEIEPGGRLCRCGKRGHVESYAGFDGMLAAARERGCTAKSVAALAEQAKDGDMVACDVLATAGVAVGKGIVAIRTLFDPPYIQVRSRVLTSCVPFAEALKETVRQDSFQAPVPDEFFEFRKADMTSGAIGAACAAIIAAADTEARRRRPKRGRRPSVQAS